jgi:hypothetical protein
MEIMLTPQDRDQRREVIMAISCHLFDCMWCLTFYASYFA